MADELSHISLALNNQKTIEYLSLHYKDYSDWITTVAFYKALHIIEAIFFNDKNIVHRNSHNDRELVLKTTRKYNYIYKQYRKLYNASMVARYLEDPGKKFASHSGFSKYMSPEDVLTKVLQRHLHAIEKSSRKFLSEKANTILDSQFTKVKKQ